MALRIALEGDNRLFNQYGVILVNPVKHPNVKKDLGQQFIDWLVSYDGQRPSPPLRSMASSCFSGTPATPTRS
jgi:ABC-type tungstate transport system permease subunit